MGATSRAETGDLVALLEDVIRGSKRRLWLKVPWIDASPTVAPLLTCLEAARRRGVDVRIVLRPEASNQIALQRLAQHKISTKPSRYLHEKEVLADDRLVTFSANFTHLELTRNINTSYEIDRPEDITASVDAFEVLWQANNADVAAGDEAWTAADTIVPHPLQRFLGRTRLNPLQSKALPAVFGSSTSLIITLPT